MSIHEQIMKIVNEWESTDKSAFIEDLLIMLDDDLIDILFKLQSGD